MFSLSSISLKAENGIAATSLPDSIRDAQILYNGIVWTNLYYRIREDQFFLSREMLPGTVTISGKTFRDQFLRYDIYNDELMLPNPKGLIIQLNREMVDSFSLAYNNIVYRFEKFRPDSANQLSGYLNVLCKGRCSLYVKYRKEVELLAVDKKYDKFYQLHRIYLIKDGTVYPIGSPRDFYRLTGDLKTEIRSYLKKNRYFVTRRIPESFIPAVAYFNTLLKR